jgi:DNA-directed RNA polymerase specialized sigma24 family protein
VLRAALTSLSQRDQEVLRLVAWDGLTPAQLATALGCSPVAARARLHRARGRLARRLGIERGMQHHGPPEQKRGKHADPIEVPR